jgi:hypothetical protein
MLFVQICPLAQATLQPPQWSALLAGSAQSPPQSIWGSTQLRVQTPLTQACPATQATPQLPQFCGSFAVSAVQGVPLPPAPPVPLEVPGFFAGSLEQAASE